MTGALFITDGTTRINLLTGVDGYRLVNWTPSIPPTKQTWRDSPLSDGRKLAMSKWANAIETFNLRVARFTQDAIIEDLQELRRLLLAAREYFIGGSDVPVWIEARGDCETNTRYATICDWRAETDDDPYHKPFTLDNPAVDGFTLILERQHWRDLAPGSSTCVQLSATQAYHSSPLNYFGPEESADDCHVINSLTSIDLNNVRLYFGKVGVNDYDVGIRFRDVVIPKNATILLAYVYFECDATRPDDTCKVIISAEDVDDGPIFINNYADFAARARTATHVHWTIDDWTIGQVYQSPDIKTIIQGQVNRAGWVSGNDINIFFDDDASTNDAYRMAVSWDHADPGAAPTLAVWWTGDDTKTYGRVATCNNEVYVGNKHNIAQLTHIYVNDGGVFGVNLVGAGAVGFPLLPAAPAAFDANSDAINFGIDSLAPNGGPFSSLVFDLSAVNDTDTIAWEYWNGAWVALTVQDNTNANGAMTGNTFDTLGVNSVHWLQPADWVTTGVNGITGYWVRARVTAVAGAAQAPAQQNRDIYTIVTPFIEIGGPLSFAPIAPATTIAYSPQPPGDITALVQMYLHAQSGRHTNTLAPNHIIAGLRSYDRGANFTAYLNLSDEQNQAGVTVQDSAGITADFTTDVLRAPSGRLIYWHPAAASNGYPARVTLDSTLSNMYKGTFRCLMRLEQTGGAITDVSYILRLATNYYANILWSTDPKYITTVGEIRYIDFGKITLPPAVWSGVGYQSTIFVVEGNNVNTGGCAVRLIDLILIPADECLFDSEAIPSGTNYYNSDALEYYGGGAGDAVSRRLDINSLIPRHMITTELEREDTGLVVAPWNTRIANNLIYQPNERQRWWFFMDDKVNALRGCSLSQALSVQSWKVSRYLSMRGTR